MSAYMNDEQPGEASESVETSQETESQEQPEMASNESDAEKSPEDLLKETASRLKGFIEQA